MRRQLRYYRLDVFTDKRFCGNPLAVVEAADGLTTSEMQQLAREFNLSETVFLVEPKDPVNTARLRIFTPSVELPFAGHPAVGAAALIAELRAAEIIARSDVALVLETSVGHLRCEARRTPSKAVYADCALPILPQKLGDAPTKDEIAAALSLAPNEIGFDAHMPVRYSAGVAFLFAPIASRAALERARRGQGFGAALGGAAGVYLYTKDAAEPSSAVHARMLADMRLGVDEDPATGSAAAAFAGVACEFERPQDGEHELFIEQGYTVGRPSLITLGLNVEGGALSKLRIGGQVVRVGEGTIAL
ncbi:MAG: PhzF family phenazine biosynthesis protein [Methylocystis sp.]|nr:PhzF family phenazine biosynthesis protein [Methylocystis sp.]